MLVFSSVSSIDYKLFTSTVLYCILYTVYCIYILSQVSLVYDTVCTDTSLYTPRYQEQHFVRELFLNFNSFMMDVTLAYEVSLAMCYLLCRHREVWLVCF